MQKMQRTITSVDFRKMILLGSQALKKIGRK